MGKGPLHEHASAPDAALRVAGRTPKPPRQSDVPTSLAGRLSSPSGILYLQAAAGNAAVSQALSVQRYDSFEHVKAGAVESFIGPAETDYVVEKGDTTASIAAKKEVSEASLIQRNRKKLHTYATAGGRGEIEDFAAGDTIAIPSDKLRVREPAKGETQRTDQKQVTIHTVKMDYGEALAMADFYRDWAQMEAAAPTEINALLVLIRRQVATPGSVKESEWDSATGGRYMELNRQNRSHFAPRDTALIPATGASSGINHKASWEENHRMALKAAVAGDRDRALAINAFGDHYLTDAFAAGHLFNKEDLMKLVRGRLSNKSQVKAFAEAIANAVFTGHPTAVTICSPYETPILGVSIKDADKFASVLEGIDEKMPDVLENSIAAAVHDNLNTNGVHVANKKAAWTVKGDDHLEGEGLFYMQEAVAQSQINVLNTPKGSAPDYPTLLKAVWDLTPQPDTSGKAAIAKAVKDLSDPSSATTIAAVADITWNNLELIMDKVVAFGKLKKVVPKK